ncbi:hypothetical protein TSOC_004149 [Tetrabaena socialis]|uniref:Uncharacterized protein n=1 Tax=Tetrabaena socialis TaxID=47790 RepID=A0A2J8A9M6_9CHLO|nr:hypothetical protein TSOC_004149 [Tetrabaena socialis]|eukprot:PNH09237.1 hypothetical protein TSOC_004149 [Tetrabaena socialis]
MTPSAGVPGSVPVSSTTFLGAPLPASPLPSWADALAGGWLPCLERLLRRDGEDLAGPEARFAVDSLAFCLPDVEQSTLAWWHLAVLLACGEPRQAAALVATLGKLLRAADLPALTMEDDRIAAIAVLWALMGGIEEWEAADGAAALMALALMAPCATCEWLPSLARFGGAGE